jgi:chromate transport protein ChrA
VSVDGATWGTRTGFVGALLATTCCALPSLLVTLGLGGALASVVSAVPGVTWLSAHKAWVFVAVGLLLAAAWAMMTGRVPTAWLRARVCPAGGPPVNVRSLWRISVVLYLLSLGVAYLGAPLARTIWG